MNPRLERIVQLCFGKERAVFHGLSFAFLFGKGEGKINHETKTPGAGVAFRGDVAVVLLPSSLTCTLLLSRNPRDTQCERERRRR